MEDKELSGAEVTRRVLEQTLNSVEEYLQFTTEIGEEFSEGWLPTLDTSFKIGEQNQILFRYFEKETCSRMTVQQKTAMNENTKIQVVSNDLVRRLLNSSEELGSKEKARIVDQYGQKLLDSGYSREQTIRILVAGIKGFEGKVERCRKEGRRLRRRANESRGARTRKQLLGNTDWFKKKGKGSRNTTTTNGGSKGRNQRQQGEQEIACRTVLFLEYSNGGELARRMKELMKRLAPMLGFGIKIVERAGRTLRSQFPLSSLWDGAPCGRMECVTCTQGADKIPPCTRKSLVYENICKECNQGAGGKEEVKNNVDTPSIYVGETSRTIKERGEEHWGAAKCRSEKSHMFKHRELHHGGQEAAFILQPISFHKSALSRQIAEAVRIRRRGGEGAILNSKAEFSRCRIPRLQLEKEEENEDLIAKEQERKEQRENEMEQELLTWEKEHVKRKSRELKEGIHLSSSHVRAREQEEKDGKIPKRMRKLKYSVIGEEWGDPEGAELNLLEEEESTLLPKEALLRNKQCSITEYLSKKNENAATPPMKRKRKPSNEENQASKPNSPKKPSNPSVPNPVKIQEGASPAQVYPSVGNLGEGCLGGH